MGLSGFATSFLRGNPSWWLPLHARAPGELARDETMPMSWEEICRQDEFRGRWVALDECHYDEGSGRATEGSVIDVDDDLVELCNRIRESEYKNCAILFVGEDGAQEPPGDGDDEDPFEHSAH